MFACICAAATEAEVRECVRAGARTLDEIGDDCGAGTGCGSCHSRLDGLLLTTAASDDLDRLPATA